MTLSFLPQYTLSIIYQNSPLKSLMQLGATCHQFKNSIEEDSQLWKTLCVQKRLLPPLLSLRGDNFRPIFKAFTQIQETKIATGKLFTLFLNQKGKLISCGRVETGEFIGLDPIVQDYPYLNPCIFDEPCTVLSAGEHHGVVVSKEGKTYCFGENFHGQLGLFNEPLFPSFEPAPKFNPFFDSYRITSVACGSDFSLFLSDKGSLFSCGKNESGELGTGDTEKTLRVHPIQMDEPIVEIAAGKKHSLAIGQSGGVYTWGENNAVQLGYEIEGHQAFPTQLPLFGERGFKVSAGEAHSCVLTERGNVYGFGRNTYGELGVEGQYLFPTLIFKDAIRVSCGAHHTLFLDNSGTIFQCGSYFWNPLAEAFQKEIAKGIYKVPTPEKILQISAGYDHFGAVSVSGKWYTWGRGNKGQLGTGMANLQQRPMNVEFSKEKKESKPKRRKVSRSSYSA